MLVLLSMSLLSGLSSNNRSSGDEIARTVGVIATCQQTTDSFTVGVKDKSGVIRELSGNRSSVTFPSESYARVVRQPYAITAHCPAAGTLVTVTECRGCRSPNLIAIETGISGADAIPRDQTLWIFREYVDGESADQRDLAFFSLWTLSKYNRFDGGHRQLWLRAKIEYLLDAYSTVEKGRAMVKQFAHGEPQLLAGVPALAQTLQSSRGHIGLASALPFEPPDPRSSAFVGYWGIFPSVLYIDDGHLGLTLMYKGSGK